jgi:Flagellar biosynthesis protein, FliO
VTWPPLTRLPGLPGARARLLLGAAGAAALALLALPGEAPALAARAALAAAAVGGVALLARRTATSPPGPALRIEARSALGRDALVAVVTVDDRRFLVAAAGAAVELLVELEPAKGARS